jgi:membrane protein
MTGPREVVRPVLLPRDAWGATLKRTLLEFRDDQLNHWGAALTYYAVLSVFPALLVLVSLVGLFADPDRVTKVLTDTVTQLGPDSASRTFEGPIRSITAHRGAAGAVAVAGILAALWAASAYVSAFTAACNAIYEVDEGRPFWKRKPLELLVTAIIIMIATGVALGLVLTGPLVGALGGALGVSHSVLVLWRYAKWPAMAALVLVVLGVLYYATPNARVRGVSWITPGAVLALATWVGASLLLALYVSHFSSYDKTYGALGGVVVFLVWFWITNMAILLGAELNAEIERAHELEEGVPGARRELQVAERQAPDPRQ